MFNQTRPQFGGGTGFSFGSTNNNKPGFGSSSSFGRPAFGAPQNQTSGFSAFGTTNTSTPSLFGTQAQQPTGGLFGQTQNPTSGFGGTSTGFGGGGLFVSQANTSGSTSLFGSNTPSTFNTSQQKGPFTFGTATTSAGTGLFGANTGSLFSTSTGGFGATNTPVGTTVKYAPVTGTDTMNRNNVSTNIQTKIEVITCMKEYENKSLEELRVEDLLAGRKGPSQGSVLGGFGQPTTATPQTGGLFGTQPTSGTSLFGTKPAENRPLFGTNTNTGFGTGTGTSGGGLFGTSTAATGFGQPSTAAPTTSFSFGQPNKTTGSFGFGTSNTTTPSLFGQPQQQPNTSGFGGFSSFGTSTPWMNHFSTSITLTLEDILEIQNKAFNRSSQWFITALESRLRSQDNTITQLLNMLERTTLSQHGSDTLKKEPITSGSDTTLINHPNLKIREFKSTEMKSDSDDDFL